MQAAETLAGEINRLRITTAAFVELLIGYAFLQIWRNEPSVNYAT
jgi:hypothetical protein